MDNIKKIEQEIENVEKEIDRKVWNGDDVLEYEFGVLQGTIEGLKRAIEIIKGERRE